MPGKTVGTRYFSPTITAPALTIPDLPAVVPVSVGFVVLEAVQIIIPAGHNGLTGIALSDSGQVFLPFDDPPTFLIGDDDDQTYDVGIEVANLLEILVYNTDVFDHAWHVRLRVRDFTMPVASARPMIPNGQLASP